MKRQALWTAESCLHGIQTLQRARAEIIRLRKELNAIKSGTGLMEKGRFCIIETAEARIFEPDQIIRCRACSNYTQIFLISGKSLTVSTTLKKVALPLSAEGFLRIHRTHLVNPNYIQKIIKGKDLTLQLCDGSLIPVSRNSRKILKQWLNTLRPERAMQSPEISLTHTI